MERYTVATRLLDYHNQELLHKREHLLTNVKPRDQLKVLYEYVAALPQCYSRNDDITASEVLREHCGQCNTKVTLLMALARGAGIPCRLHAYRIHKHVQRGRVPGWMLHFAPRTTVFLWPEFYVDKRWQPLQKLVHEDDRQWNACPFDGACFIDSPLRQEWIAEDHGVWDSPDDYFARHKPTVHGWRKIGWPVGRRILNRK